MLFSLSLSGNPPYCVASHSCGISHKKYPRTTDTCQAKQGCKFDAEVLLYLQLTTVSNIAPGIKEKIVRGGACEWPYRELRKKLRDVGLSGEDSTGNIRWHRSLRACMGIIFSKEKKARQYRGLKKLICQKKVNYFWLLLRNIIIFQRLPDCQFLRLNISVFHRCMEIDTWNCSLWFYYWNRRRHKIKIYLTISSICL